MQDVLTARAEWERTHDRVCQTVYLSVPLASVLNRQCGQRTAEAPIDARPGAAWVVDRKLTGEAFRFE